MSSSSVSSSSISENEGYHELHSPEIEHQSDSITVAEEAENDEYAGELSTDAPEETEVLSGIEDEDGSVVEAGAVDNHVAESKSQEQVQESDVVSNGSAPQVGVAEEIEVFHEPASVWRNNFHSEFEIERRSSPSSSGYAGERGSSGASSVSGESREDEIQEEVNGVSDSQSAWIPGKRHVDEVRRKIRLCNG